MGVYNKVIRNVRQLDQVFVPNHMMFKEYNKEKQQQPVTVFL